MATLQERNGSYRVLFVHGGTRHTFTLGAVPKAVAAAAVRKADEVLALVKAGYLALPAGVAVADFVRLGGKAPPPVATATLAGAVKPPPAPEVPTLALLRDRYLAAHEGSLEANTMALLRTHFRHLAKALGAESPLAGLTAGRLQGYADARKSEVSPVTVKKELVTLRTAWNWGRLPGLTPAAFIPLKQIRLGKVDEKPPFQTRAEIDRKLAHGGTDADAEAALWECLYLEPPEVKEFLEYLRLRTAVPWLYPMAAAAAHTGARRSELMRLRPGDVDLAAGTLTVPERKRTKGANTTRRIPLTPFLSQVLAAWLAARPKGANLFCHGPAEARGETGGRGTQSEPGSGLSVNVANDHFQRATRGSKWEVMRGWHVLRHSACSAMAAAGVDQRVIDEVMGHTQDEQRRRYRHLTPTLKADAMRRAFG